MSKIIAPSAGFKGDALQLPELDFANASEHQIGDSPIDIELNDGVYFLVANSDFSFSHLKAGDAHTLYAPWSAGIYLTLFLSSDQTLTVFGEPGVLKIIPAKVWSNED